MITSVEDLAAEDALQAQYAATAWREILHIAQCLQPDAGVLDVRRAGQVWAPLRRAWVAAGEVESFMEFVDAQLAAAGALRTEEVV